MFKNTAPETQLTLLQSGQPEGHTYGADTVGVVLLDVGADGGIHGASPALDAGVHIMGSGVTRLLPQVVELEGNFVLGVQNATIAQVAVLCD